MAVDNHDQLPIQVEQLKFALDNVPAYVYIKSDHSRYVYANKLTLGLFGCTEQEIYDRCDHDFFPSDTVKKLLEVDARVLQGERTQEEIVVSYPDGKKTVYWEVKTPIFDEQVPCKVIGILGISTDITEQKELEEQLAHAASTDPLTGLLNRRYFFDRLDHALQLSKRYQSYGGVIFIDLDKFKKVNDAYGHRVGDAYLIEIANRMKREVREADSLARIGGDEFVVLLEGLGSKELAAKENVCRVADKIQTAINDEFCYQGISYKGTASVGVSVFLGADKSAQEIVAQADEHMFIVKRAIG